jgi:hypothetical protein
MIRFNLDREPINSEALANVRFNSQPSKSSDVRVGHSCQLDDVPVTSAYLPIAAVSRTSRHVAFVPFRVLLIGDSKAVQDPMTKFGI